MWALDNRTPFAADRTFARDRDGSEVWIVAVRATYSIGSSGELSLVEPQPPVVLAPDWCGEPGQSSLRSDGDLVPRKPGTDVLLHGSAHAPRGRAATEVIVQMRVGPIEKSLRVTGERRWVRSRFGVLDASAPLPFMTQRLCWEAAYGGTRTTPDGTGIAAVVEGNPIGRGLVAAEGQLLPSIERTRVGLADTLQGALLPEPAGLGPLPAHWQPRRSRAGTYDERWQRERQPLLPDDFDARARSSAPDDQFVPGFLKGGERVELTALTPEGRVRFELPRVALGFATRVAGAIERHRADLTTVAIDTDERRLAMVWVTSLPCHFTLHSLQSTTILEKERRPKGCAPAPTASDDRDDEEIAA